jgi:hypothetical protein
MPVVGFLRSTAVNGFENIEAAFRQGLDEEGFVEGRTASVGGLVVFREFRDDDRTGPDHDLRPEVKGHSA